jgi:hypothetical protein
MSYVPPFRRPSLVGNVIKNQKLTKQEHREQFPALKDILGNAIPVKPIAPVVVNWNTITYEVDELPRATVDDADDGWVNLSTYIPNPDTALTSDQLIACSERLENNWRRYYLERDLPIPKWITDSPYDNYEDFDRTIPYSSDYITVSDTESSVCDDEEYISDHSM